MIDEETLLGRPGADASAVPMLSARCAPASFRDEHLDDVDDSQSMYAPASFRDEHLDDGDDSQSMYALASFRDEHLSLNMLMIV